MSLLLSIAIFFIILVNAFMSNIWWHYTEMQKLHRMWHGMQLLSANIDYDMKQNR